MITTIGAYLTAWLASRWLSWLGTVVGWVWWAITTAIKGTLSFLQNPAEAFAVAVIAAVTFGLGAWMMYGFVGHRVKTVEAQMTALWQDMSKKDREDAERAAQARKARAEAEAAERQRQASEAKPPAPAPAVSASAVVRKGAAPVRRRQCEQGLLGCL